MISVLPTTSNDVVQNEMSMDCSAPTTSLFKLKHLEFFCGRIPVKIYYDKHSCTHYASVESPATNLTNVSVSYVTYPSAYGLPNVTANLVLTGTEKNLAADRFEYYLGNVFSANSIDINVEPGNTAFSFNLIGGTSGSIQLLSLLLDNLSTPSFGERDFRHQVFNPEEVSGKLYERLQAEESCLQNAVNRARHSRSFHGSIFAHDHVGTSDDLRMRSKKLKIAQYLQSFYQDPWILLSGNVLDLDLNLLDTLLLKQSYATKYKGTNQKIANYAELYADHPISDIPFHYTDVVAVSGTYNSIDKGIVQIGFLAESPTNATFTEAIHILAEYLCGSETSPLNQLLATGPERIVFINQLFDALANVKWDLQQLHEIITHKVRHYSELTESNISNEVFERLRRFQLYADAEDPLTLKRLLNPVMVLNEVMQFSQVYWQTFARRLFVENCSVVIGVPDNISIQRHLLNPELTPQRPTRDKRLRRSTELLKVIYKPNDSFFSQEIIDVATAPVFPFHQTFPTTLKAFHWNITGSKVNLLPEWFKAFKQLVDPSIPLSITVHPIESSEFVKAVFLFDVRTVEQRLRYYILLFIKLLFKSSSSINGNFMSSAEIKRAMQNELAFYDCKVGFNENSRYILQLTLKASASKLEYVEKWFQAIMCNAVFGTDDLVESVHSLIESGNKMRQNGVLFCNTLLDSVNFNQDNEHFFLNELVLEPFYAEMMQSFLNGSYQHALDDLQSLRSQILNSRISLHLVGNPKKFSTLHQLAFEDLKRFRINDKVEKITVDSKVSSVCNWPLKPEIHIVGTKANRLLFQLVERFGFNCEPFDDSHAAILIFCTYFSTKGGIFWRCIREDGQAGDVQLSFDIHRRTLMLTMKDAKNPKATRESLFYLLRQMFIDSIDSDLFKVSQRKLAAQIVEQYSNVELAGTLSIFNDVHGWTIDQITSFVHKILVIKESRCQVLLYDLISQVCLGKSLMAIVCPQYQVSHQMQNFKNILQPNLLVQHTNEKQFELL
ncbi:hypothetical protein M3Y97_00841000 [Aphelenchoides bicaudatus]|nr:hypothetical protein M3Y97_00841000 [Aphelenchoides bicaudatus]